MNSPIMILKQWRQVFSLKFSLDLTEKKYMKGKKKEKTSFIHWPTRSLIILLPDTGGTRP